MEERLIQLCGTDHKLEWKTAKKRAVVVSVVFSSSFQTIPATATGVPRSMIAITRGTSVSAWATGALNSRIFAVAFVQFGLCSHSNYYQFFRVYRGHGL